MENIFSSIIACKNDSKEIGRVLELVGSRMHELDEKTVKALFGIFNDSSDQDMLWELLHLLENLGDLVFVKCYVDSIETLKRNNAIEWIETISCRILNGGSLVDVFREELLKNPLGMDVLKECLYPISLENRPIGHKVGTFLSHLG